MGREVRRAEERREERRDVNNVLLMNNDEFDHLNLRTITRERWLCQLHITHSYLRVVAQSGALLTRNPSDFRWNCWGSKVQIRFANVFGYIGVTYSF